ncbi:MAG: S8 family serine peptidase [Planctomycetota bacterium]|nr:S8 family serine peptidase [Planctomycetota bacterium]
MSTIPSSQYTTMSGTSMASPHVAGAVALLRSYRPDLNYQDILGAIYRGVEQISALQGITITGGRLNLKNAIDQLPALPVMIAPSGTVTQLRPFFEWSTGANADHYELAVDNLTTNTTDYYAQKNVVTTSHLALEKFAQGAYQASVRTVTATGAMSPWSNFVNFTISIPAPAVPTITAPIGDITNSFPTFVWSNDVLTSNYSLWVNDITNPKLPTRVIYRTAYRDTAYVHFDALKDGTYRAWVRAFNSIGEFSAWSTPVTFTIDSPVPVAPVISAPAALITNETPRIIWNAVNGAARYDLWVNNLTTGASQYIRKSNISRLTPFFDTPALPQGSYRVWVRAASGDNQFSNWSSHYTFTVDIERPAATRITAPNNGAVSITITNANPTFTWDPAVRAVKYALWVNNVTTGQTQIIRQQNIVGASYVALNKLPQGNYRAWVRGINSADEVGNWSTVSIFTIDEPTPSLPQIIEPKSNPAGSVENPNPTFVWTSEFDAPFYEFRLDDQTLNKKGVISVKDITGRSYTIPNEKRLAEHIYVAFVRGVNNAGEMSDWSPAFRVRIDVPNPTTPTIIGPKLTSKDTTPTFEWTLDSGSFRFEILVRDLERNETIVLQVKQYSVNATDPTNKFAYYTLPDNKAFKPGTYRFWIRAFNAIGTASSWSNSQSFVISASLDLKDLKIVEPARMQAAEEFYADATFYPDQEDLTVTQAAAEVVVGDTIGPVTSVDDTIMPVAMIEELMESLSDPSSATAAMLSGVAYDDPAIQSGTDKTTVAAASILALAMMPVRRKRREEQAASRPLHVPEQR